MNASDSDLTLLAASAADCIADKLDLAELKKVLYLLQAVVAILHTRVNLAQIVYIASTPPSSAAKLSPETTAYSVPIPRKP